MQVSAEPPKAQSQQHCRGDHCYSNQHARCNVHACVCLYVYRTYGYMAQVVDVRGQDFSEEVQRVYWAITIGRMLFSKHDVFEYGTPGTSEHISVPLKGVSLSVFSEQVCNAASFWLV